MSAASRCEIAVATRKLTTTAELMPTRSLPEDVAAVHLELVLAIWCPRSSNCAALNVHEKRRARRLLELWQQPGPFRWSGTVSRRAMSRRSSPPVVDRDEAASVKTDDRNGLFGSARRRTISRAKRSARAGSRARPSPRPARRSGILDGAAGDGARAVAADLDHAPRDHRRLVVLGERRAPGRAAASLPSPSSDSEGASD